MGELMPLPNTRVIHPNWSAHHRPTATGAMTATCRITRTDGDGTVGADGTWTPPAATTVYTGPCMVIAPSFERNPRVSAEQTQMTRRDYMVSVPWDVPEIHIGDVITVTSAVDPRLAGRTFAVTGLEYESEQWQRTMLAEEVEGRVVEQ
ncbi:hypothetical protein BJF79_13815 [Actinomadura sp. CNU-125]|uniref:DUF6093 family protein n=1 Tax=Actinomadura sp. CNU-125 TaxID=1904961 RepID=UPI00096804D8|nr:DUF6093 family protein [Actinomadura sp. CNU-125]OLT24414.1 hypothetical protein BJF79_13815 [Actinomadura sp. CNU-125]